MASEIQSHKLSFIQEYLRLNDENIIHKLTDFLHNEKSKKVQENLKRMTEHELIEKLNKSEKDIEQGKLISQSEIKEYFNIK